MDHRFEVKIKRVYEQPAEDDGTRILVDRLWPHGMTRERAALDLWMKDIAPSPGLRTWYGHDPGKWEEFKRQYVDELKANGTAVAALEEEMKKGVVTLVYAAKDKEHSHALVLQNFLTKRTQP